MGRCLTVPRQRRRQPRLVARSHESLGAGVKTSGCGSPEAARVWVGATGFEPATPRSRTVCSTRLSHAPSLHLAHHEAIDFAQPRFETPCLAVRCIRAALYERHSNRRELPPMPKGCQTPPRARMRTRGRGDAPSRARRHPSRSRKALPSWGPTIAARRHAHCPRTFAYGGTSDRDPASSWRGVEASDESPRSRTPTPPNSLGLRAPRLVRERQRGERPRGSALVAKRRRTARGPPATHGALRLPRKRAERRKPAAAADARTSGPERIRSCPRARARTRDPAPCRRTRRARTARRRGATERDEKPCRGRSARGRTACITRRPPQRSRREVELLPAQRTTESRSTRSSAETGSSQRSRTGRLSRAAHATTSGAQSTVASSARTARIVPG